MGKNRTTINAVLDIPTKFSEFDGFSDWNTNTEHTDFLYKITGKKVNLKIFYYFLHYDYKSQVFVLALLDLLCSFKLKF